MILMTFDAVQELSRGGLHSVMSGNLVLGGTTEDTSVSDLLSAVVRTVELMLRYRCNFFLCIHLAVLPDNLALLLLHSLTVVQDSPTPCLFALLRI